VITLLHQSAALLAALCAFFGLLIGSFLNVVILRIPRMLENEENAWLAEREGKVIAPPPVTLNLIAPGSRCPSCGHKIRALENIPVFSYLVLGGKCSACKTPIGLRYPLVEVLTAVLSVLVGLHFGVQGKTIPALVFLYFLIALSFIDFDTQILPDRLTLPLVWLGLLVNLTGGGFASLQSAVIGGAAGYLSLWLVYWAFKLATGKEGMGYGDFKLLAAIGAWLGWEMLPVVVLLSSVAGALIGVVLILATRRGKEVPMPFGPYLAIAGVFAMLYGKDLVQGYLGLFP
jgi:leader peptidase (prepilin peptidase) / N-methyltransferase